MFGIKSIECHDMKKLNITQFDMVENVISFDWW